MYLRRSFLRNVYRGTYLDLRKQGITSKCKQQQQKLSHWINNNINACKNLNKIKRLVVDVKGLPIMGD